MAQAQKRHPINAQAYEPSARSRALLRGIEMAEQDLRAAGGTFELDQVRTILRGVSRQAIEKRVREGSILAVPGPSNRRRYPAIQFMPDGSVAKGLRAVREALPSHNPWLVLNFLVNPDPRLNRRRPIDLLRAGEVAGGRVGAAGRRTGSVSAPWPPPDLARRTALIETLEAGSELHRFYTATQAPIFFDRSRHGRLNAPDRAYGVLYVAALGGRSLRRDLPAHA
jgi:hypothetical protein